MMKTGPRRLQTLWGAPPSCGWTKNDAWGENVGWINLDDTTHFVSVDAASSPIACDTNHDGLVNGGDVQSFIDFVLLNSSPDWRDVCSGDVEAVPDKVIELDDVANFVDCLLM